MTEHQLNCLLSDGTIDLDKLAEATQLVKQYRELWEVADALYNGDYKGDCIAIHVVCQKRGYNNKSDEPTTLRVLPMNSTDIEGLVRNKEQAVKEKINDLGFSV